MKHFVRLSYSMNRSMSLYPGTPGSEIFTIKSKGMGDSCNTSKISISNHAGTHIDGPAHFDNSGKRIEEYDIESLVFEKPLVVNCIKQAQTPILPDDLTGQLKEDCDLLLIRTGFSKHRRRVIEDCYSDVYCSRNPYLHSDTAEMLRSRYPNIRAIGIDCISIGCHADRDNGRKTHDILLSGDNRYPGNPVLIIEDMLIPGNLMQFDEIIVAPLYVESIDSAPCTVIGVYCD